MGVEVVQNFTKQSILYANICATCVPGVRGKEQVKEEHRDKDRPTLYIGEMSSTIRRMKVKISTGSVNICHLSGSIVCYID